MADGGRNVEGDGNVLATVASGTGVQAYRRVMTTGTNPTGTAGEVALDWVPQACTLPRVEQPIRRAEFDAVFASATSVERSGPTSLRILLSGDESLAATVRDLAARESECCSFFTFAVDDGDGVVTMDVSVAAVHLPVLEALSERAAAVSGSAAR
jgi:hypothetical protein